MRAAFEAARSVDSGFESWYRDYAYCRACGEHTLHETTHVCAKALTYRDNIITHRTDASIPGSKLVVTDLHLSDEMREELTIKTQEHLDTLRNKAQEEIDSKIRKLFIVGILGALFYVFLRLIGLRF